MRPLDREVSSSNDDNKHIEKNGDFTKSPVSKKQARQITTPQEPKITPPIIPELWSQKHRKMPGYQK